MHSRPHHSETIGPYRFVTRSAKAHSGTEGHTTIPREETEHYTTKLSRNYTMTHLQQHTCHSLRTECVLACCATSFNSTRGAAQGSKARVLTLSSVQP